MKALLYKDFMSSRSTFIATILFLVAFSIFMTFQNNLILILFLFIYLPVILNVISFGIEMQSNFYKFIFVTPVSRKTYVRSKYVISVICSILALITSIILILNAFNEIGLGLLVGAIAFAIPLIFTSIQIPIILYFGEERARIVMAVTYFALFFMPNLLGFQVNSFMNFILTTNQSQLFMLSVLIFIVTILILFLSQKVGELIMIKKEH